MTATAATMPVLLAEQPGIKAREGRDLSLALADRFVSLLKDLSPEEWNAVTACDPWTVKDVAVHLLGWADALCSPRAMVSQGRAALRRRKRFANLLDAQNDAQVEGGRAYSTDEVVARLREMLPRAARLRRRLGGALHYVPAYAGFLGGPFNLGYLLNSVFPRDLVVHELDICAATGRTATFDAASTRVATDMLKDWARRTAADATVELEGLGTFVAGTGRAAHISADGAAFVLRLGGREPARPETVTGDEAAARRWIAAGCPV
ncbi:MAG TPA: maleylpyruvate isomerase family mycothiol-dependent enzyme [Actinomycetota bacterium]|nr:maleylpyruvate isomerase family mycothiol-dependent enzyme [Actinomycetota bacterium]